MFQGWFHWCFSSRSELGATTSYAAPVAQADSTLWLQREGISAFPPFCSQGHPVTLPPFVTPQVIYTNGWKLDFQQHLAPFSIAEGSEERTWLEDPHRIRLVQVQPIGFYGYGRHGIGSSVFLFIGYWAKTSCNWVFCYSLKTGLFLLTWFRQKGMSINVITVTVEGQAESRCVKHAFMLFQLKDILIHFSLMRHIVIFSGIWAYKHHMFNTFKEFK